MNKLDGVVCDICRKRIRSGYSENHFDICKSCQQDSPIVDNFDAIADLLIFDDANTFYWIQVIGRKKDNPGTKNRVCAEFIIYSIQQLYQLKPELIKLSKLYNARVVFWINRRDMKELAIPMSKLTLSYMESKQYASLPKVFQRVCGQHSKKGVKPLFLIDVDSKEEVFLNKVVNVLKTCGEITIEALLPTVKGFHILCSAFNVALFKLKLEEANLDPVTVQKDNPTLLYYCP